MALLIVIIVEVLMKRLFITLISAILVCAMAFAFIGCNDDSGEEKQPHEEQKEIKLWGTFFWLDAAYADGLISYDALRSIAYYYNGESAEIDFVPIPKDPETLSDETILKIQETYYVGSNGAEKGATLDDVVVGDYCGTYNGCVIVSVIANCTSGIGGDPIDYEKYEIGGVVFNRYTPLRVWKAFDE